MALRGVTNLLEEMIKLLPSNSARCAPLMFENGCNAPDVPPDFSLKELMRRFSIQGWSFVGIFDDDELIGVVSFQGNQIHLDLIPSRHAKWNARHVLPRILDIGFKRRKHLVTYVHKSNLRAIRIVEKVGFKEFKRCEAYIHYRMSKSERKM